MEENDRIYKETFPIQSYGVRPDKSARLAHICNLLQEVAGKHAHRLNYDIDQLRRENRTWFLYRLQLEMEDYPRWDDSITIETWPSGGKGVLAYREFLIYNESMDILGRGTSQWMIVDLQKKRPVPIPGEVFEMKVEKRGHTLKPQREKINLDHQDPLGSPTEFRIWRKDLDVNGHVNNVSYINWITESIPEDIYSEHRLNHLDIIYQAECKYGDKVIVKTYPTDQDHDFKHHIYRSQDQKTLALAQTRWGVE